MRAVANQTNIETVAHMGFAERIDYYLDLNGDGTEQKMLKQKYLVGAIVNQTNIGTVAHTDFAERIGYHHDLNGNGTEQKGSNKNTWAIVSQTKIGTVAHNYGLFRARGLLS